MRYIRFGWSAILSLMMFSMWLPSYAATVGSDTFGLHIHALARNIVWPSFQFGFIRLWDSNVRWLDIEPKKGAWNFDLLDKYVDNAEKNNVQIMLTLGQTPPWAASRPRDEGVYGMGANSEPRDMLDWENYVRTLATRYKGRIRHWEVWNEANVEHFYSGNWATLAELERRAAMVLKAVDASNVVLTPSIQGGAFNRLDAYFEAGGGRHADVISYHFYAPKDLPEVVADRIKRVRTVMSKHGLAKKPLWNTETGWLIANSDGGFGRQQRPAWAQWRKLGYEEAAGVVMRTFLVNLDGGINHVFWYAWNNGAMGLAEDQGRKPKPAAMGYARAMEWLVGADWRGCAVRDQVWMCELTRGGESQHIVWSQTPRGFEIPRAWGAKSIVNLDAGVSAVPSSARINVGPEPRLLRQVLPDGRG